MISYDFYSITYSTYIRAMTGPPSPKIYLFLFCGVTMHTINTIRISAVLKSKALYFSYDHSFLFNAQNG